MSTEGERHIRLQKARKAAGFETAVEVVRAYGWKSYQNNESGTAPFSYKKAQEYARRFKVRPEWLYAGTGTMRETRVPIVGKAAAGPDGSFIDDRMPGDHPGVEPFDPEISIAVEIDGTSMVPRFRPREIAIFGSLHEDPAALINQEVLVQTHDGRQMIKILRRNAVPGHWDLHSINNAFDPIEGVRLDWARPFEGLRV